MPDEKTVPLGELVDQSSQEMLSPWKVWRPPWMAPIRVHGLDGVTAVLDDIADVVMSVALMTDEVTGVEPGSNAAVGVATELQTPMATARGPSPVSGASSVTATARNQRIDASRGWMTRVPRTVGPGPAR